MHVLDIDLGTSSVKFRLLGVDETESGAAPWPFRERAPHPGLREADPEHWWTAAVAPARRAVGTRCDDVQVIGLSRRGHGVVLTGTQVKALSPAVVPAYGRAGSNLCRDECAGYAQRRTRGSRFSRGIRACSRRTHPLSEPSPGLRSRPSVKGDRALRDTQTISFDGRQYRILSALACTNDLTDLGKEARLNIIL